MAMKPESKEAFIAFLNGVIEEFAKAVFEESQRRVPVKEGILRDSGRLTKTNNGMTITYDTPYASLIDGHGEDSTLVFRGAKSFEFPANGFVSKTVEELAEVMLPDLILQASGSSEARQYNFAIQ